MNKPYFTVSKYLKKIKVSILSFSEYTNTFSDRKKTIDSMYDTIIHNKTKEIKILEKEFKEIHSKNIQLEQQVLGLKTSLNKKNKLILSIQDLISRRVD